MLLKIACLIKVFYNCASHLDFLEVEISSTNIITRGDKMSHSILYWNIHEAKMLQQNAFHCLTF